MKTPRLGVPDELQCLIGLAAAIIALGFALRSCGRGASPAADRKIAAASAVAATLKPIAAAALAKSDTETARASSSAADYHALRARVVIDTAAKTISVSGEKGDPLPPAALSLIQSADTTIPQLRSALVTTRAGWAVDRERSDSLESALHLSESARAGPWCGRKCGIVIGVGATVGTVVVFTKYVLPLLRPHEAAGAPPRFTLRASLRVP